MTAPVSPILDDPPTLGTRVRVAAPATYEDSLDAITGRPRFRARVPWLPGEGVQGRYLPSIDALLLRKGNEDERYVEAHEAGHRLDLTSPDRAAARDNFDQYVSQHPERHAQGYAARNPAEQRAEAFANAVEFLEVSQLPEFRKKGYDPATNLDERDQRVPGTKAMVSYLLTKPLYRDHPYHASPDAIGVPTFRPAVPSVVQARDATRTTTPMAIGPKVPIQLPGGGPLRLAPEVPSRPIGAR